MCYHYKQVRFVRVTLCGYCCNYVYNIILKLISFCSSMGECYSILSDENDVNRLGGCKHYKTVERIL